jgi:mannose-1-phosphate guanylyltransferase
MMFAIKTSSKFLNVKYFIGPDVFDVSVSKNPKQWKTRAEAEGHLEAARNYFALRISHMTKITAEAHTAAAKAQSRVIKLKAELELLIEQPYKDVHAKVAQRLKELDKQEAEVILRTDCARDYGQTLARLKKLAASYYTVVAVRQVVDAECV